MTAIFTFVRHSQKESGLVFTPDTIDFSKSGISEKGKKRAANFGRKNLSNRNITSAYATTYVRTKQTLESAFEGAGIRVMKYEIGWELAPYHHRTIEVLEYYFEWFQYLSV